MQHHVNNFSLSRASRYALNAACHLARDTTGEWVSTPHIADATGIPSLFLLKALRPLVARQILLAKTGPLGGYKLARSADSISLLHILEAIDGPITALPEEEYAAHHQPKTNQKINCLLVQLAGQVREKYSATTLADLAS